MQEDSLEEIMLRRKLRFFLELRHSLGRSALLLSGGITLGMYHLGVVKALHEEGLLPRVISGSSAGSIVAGIVGTKTDEELPAVFAGNAASFQATEGQNIDIILTRRGCIGSQLLREERARIKARIPLWVVRTKNETIFD